MVTIGGREEGEAEGGVSAAPLVHGAEIEVTAVADETEC